MVSLSSYVLSRLSICEQWCLKASKQPCFPLLDGFVLVSLHIILSLSRSYPLAKTNFLQFCAITFGHSPKEQLVVLPGQTWTCPDAWEENYLHSQPQNQSTLTLQSSPNIFTIRWRLHSRFSLACLLNYDLWSGSMCSYSNGATQTSTASRTASKSTGNATQR